MASSVKETKALQCFLIGHYGQQCDEPIICCLKGDCINGIRGFLVNSFSVRCVQLASKHCFVSQEQEGTSEDENLLSLVLTATSNTISTASA